MSRDDITIKSAKIDASGHEDGVAVEHAYIEDSDVVFADDQLHVVLGELLVSDDAAAQLRVVVGEDHDGRAIPRNTLFPLPRTIAITDGTFDLGLIGSIEAPGTRLSNPPRWLDRLLTGPRDHGLGR